ncbi:hypothetical protein [Streptosporangium sp. G12]
MAHATTDDLEPYVAVVPANAQLLLARASRLVTQATMTAQYAVDDGGLPTDSAVTTALRDATCEQVAAWITDGTEDGTGAAPVYSNVSIGSVTLGGRTSGSGAAGGGGASASRLAPQAALILQQAGLTGQAPRTYC